MFVNVAFVDPSPGREKDLVSVMLAFADSLKKQPGLQRAHLLKEKDGKTLVGISMWDDENSFNEAMRTIEAQQAKNPPPSAEGLSPNPPGDASVLRNLKKDTGSA
jgi:heme-degrading monooxygenase HmoA